MPGLALRSADLSGLQLSLTLIQQAKLSIYQPAYISGLNYGHEIWVKLQIKVARMIFLHIAPGLTLRDRVRRHLEGAQTRVTASLCEKESVVVVRIPAGHLLWEIFP